MPLFFQECFDRVLFLMNVDTHRLTKIAARGIQDAPAAITNFQCRFLFGLCDVLAHNRREHMQRKIPEAPDKTLLNAVGAVEPRLERGIAAFACRPDGIAVKRLMFAGSRGSFWHGVSILMGYGFHARIIGESDSV